VSHDLVDQLRRKSNIDVAPGSELTAARDELKSRSRRPRA
jgi:hypothetical protein